MGLWTRQLLLGIACLTAVLLSAVPARAQCLLDNPSFEFAGSGGDTFSGWNHLNTVSDTPDNVPHGATAARLSGLVTGDWTLSAVWQAFDSQPGERWSASACVWHTPINPLTGATQAIVNIEWRDAADELIDFESHVAADADTPTDSTALFTVASQPAPPGTVSTRVLLGVLQSPTDPAPDVYYDLATFDNLGPPTVDDLQWNDFPGGELRQFAGRTWRVKGPGLYGPGPNLFCDTPACTWVDGSGHLHLRLQDIAGDWYSTELVLEDALGYGDYVFTTQGRLDAFHPNVVFGIFLWQYARCYDPADGWWNPFNEIDIEFSRWGDPQNDGMQFAAQPADWPGNIDRFDATFADGKITSHAMRWLPDRVAYRSWRGGPRAESPENLIHSWTYSGAHIPRPDQPRVHLNLWYINSDPPAIEQEVVLQDFNFTPACEAPHCGQVPAISMLGLAVLATLLAGAAVTMLWRRAAVP